MKSIGTVGVALVALAVAFGACAVITTIMLFRLDNLHEVQDRADSRASGRVIEDDIGEDGDIRVRWVDGDGRTYVTRFGIYDTDKYVEGTRFPVRFASDDPRGSVFPLDTEETLREDDLVAGAAIPWSIVAVAAVWWTIRLIRVTRARRGEDQQAVANVFGAHNTLAGPLSALVRTTWVRLESEGLPSMQRVAWHPALASVRYDEPVTITRGGGSASVVLADGTRLAPIGRLRAAAPARYELEDLPATRPSRANLIVRRMSAPHDPWLRALGSRAAYGGVLGAAAGLIFGSVTLVWVGALVVAALTVNLWALNGADR